MEHITKFNSRECQENSQTERNVKGTHSAKVPKNVKKWIDTYYSIGRPLSFREVPSPLVYFRVPCLLTNFPI